MYGWWGKWWEMSIHLANKNVTYWIGDRKSRRIFHVHTWSNVSTLFLIWEQQRITLHFFCGFISFSFFQSKGEKMTMDIRMETGCWHLKSENFIDDHPGADQRGNIHIQYNIRVDENLKPLDSGKIDKEFPFWATSEINPVYFFIFFCFIFRRLIFVSRVTKWCRTI